MKKIFVVLISVMIFPVVPFAQTPGGDIYGTVVLADGSKVPGVLITLTAWKFSKCTTISSEKGNFRFLALPPGNYNLTCALEGFKTVLRKDIKISLGKSVTLSIMMETRRITEEIIVPYGGDMINPRETEVGMNVDKESMESIPTGKSTNAILSAQPGVMTDRVDAGGAESGQQSPVLVGGSDQDDTAWKADGANITDLSDPGTASAYNNSNSYDELQVTRGANDVTAQTGGTQLNFVTKRGGNETSGDFHLNAGDKNWELNQTLPTYPQPPKPGVLTNVKDENWVMKQYPNKNMEERDLVVPGIQRLYQYGINFGGPVVKDKFWWFGSWAVQDIHKRTEANLEDATWLVSGFGKLNFQLGKTSGDFHISYDSKLKWGRTFLSPAQQDNDSLWDQEGSGYLLYGGLSHLFGDLILNIKAVYMNGGYTLDPRGSDISPETGHSEGNEFKIVDGWSHIEGSAWYNSTDRNSCNVILDGNYFLEDVLGGDHEIRFGVDYFNADTTTQSLTPNQRILYIYRSNPTLNYMSIVPDFLLNVNFQRISAYIHDTITWGKLTALIGFRYDKEQGRVNPITMPGFEWYEPGSPHHGKRMLGDVIGPLDIKEYKADAAWELISPRFALTYDITGDAKNVIKLSAARYMSQSGNIIASNYIPHRYGWVYWTDANGDEIPQFEEVGDLFFDLPLKQVDPITGMNNVQYDPDYNTPYLDELTLTFEKAFTDDLAISLTGFFKKKHNLSRDVNSRGEIDNVFKCIMANGSIETKENWEYMGTTLVGGTEVPTYKQIEDPVGTYFYNLDKAYDRYLGLQFVLTKRLSNRWMANLSFTLQDWKRFRFEEETLDLNNFDFFNKGVVAPATKGSGLRDIWVNSRWIVKFTGMYHLPWGINLSAFFQAREGNPQPLRRLIRLNQGAVYLYRDGYKSGDERLPTFWMLNLGLEKTFNITDTVTATLCVDWYNATNNLIELKHNLEIGADDTGEPKPIMWLNPGLFQFGVRVNF